MIATLEFTLPDDRIEHEIAVNAPRMHEALCAIANHIRARLKYGSLSEAEGAELERLIVVLQEHDVYRMVDL